MSVLTPSIPERAALLEECRASVDAQLERSYEHLVYTDSERRGCAWVMNHLASQARGRWLLPLADDDLLLPGALRSLLEAAALATDGAWIVYAPPLVWGNGDTHFWGQPPCIPSFALIPARLWRELGGYDESRRREEDRDLYTRALAAGVGFVRVDEPCWVYRFHFDAMGRPRNKSYAGGHAS